MLEQILPDSVAVAECFGDAAEAGLLPAELALIGRAVESRRREFATGRVCARTALARLGGPAAAILRGPGGAPCWPPGFIGSITHCAGYRASAVGRVADLRAVGVDAEPHAALPAGVLPVIATPGERSALGELTAQGAGTHWDRLLFSAKESVFKAWFPLAGRWLGFDDAVITIDPGAGTFEAALLVPGAEPDGRRAGFSGRWLTANGLMLTAVTVPA